MKYFSSILLLFIPTVLFAYTSPGSPNGFVNDFAHVLTDATVKTLNSELTQLAKETSTEISVVTVPTIGDDYIEHYSIKLAEEWGVGGAKKDNGVILLIATTDKKLRIEVGYGLEGALPDSLAGSIIRTEIVPKLKTGSYDDAVIAGTRAIVAATKGEYSEHQGGNSNDTLAVLFFFGVFVLQWLAAVLGRTKEWWLGGALGFLMGSFFTALNPFGLSLFAAGASILGLTIFGAFFDFVVSNTYQHDNRFGYNHPWWIGGGRGDSGGFGGFGGGSFGGGGASGSW